MDIVAWALIIIGVILIISGIASLVMRSGFEGVETKRESKGIILIGPIPIVWGYGKQVWVIAALIAILLFVILWFP